VKQRAQSNKERTDLGVQNESVVRHQSSWLLTASMLSNAACRHSSAGLEVQKHDPASCFFGEQAEFLKDQDRSAVSSGSQQIRNF